MTEVESKGNSGQQSEIAAIHELREREVAAAESGNVGALLSLRSDDFVAMPPGRPAVVGKEAVGEFLASMFDQIRLEETVVSEDVVVADDWAYDRGRFTGSVHPKGGGDPTPIDGKYLWISRRQPDGAWRYTIQMWSDN